MTISKRAREGLLQLDHSQGPGLDEAFMRKAFPGLPAAAGRGLFEAPTVTCAHCQRVVVINPDRTRDRAYCRACDAYICDDCGAAAAVAEVHLPFAKIVDDVLESVVRDEPHPSFLLKP